MPLGCKFFQLQYYQMSLKSVNIWPSNHKNKKGGLFWDTAPSSPYKVKDITSRLSLTPKLVALRHAEQQSSRFRERVPGVSVECVVDVKSGTYVGDTDIVQGLHWIISLHLYWPITEPRRTDVRGSVIYSVVIVAHIRFRLKFQITVTSAVISAVFDTESLWENWKPLTSPAQWSVHKNFAVHIYCNSSEF